MYSKLPVRRFCLFLASYLYDNTYITIKKEYGNRISMDYFYWHCSR